MQVKCIAECSKDELSAILLTCGLENQFLVFFESGRFTVVNFFPKIFYTLILVDIHLLIFYCISTILLKTLDPVLFADNTSFFYHSR